ncbi:MAG: hypothetical protein ACM4D3_09735 [Candidatus Sericytochromatia bacterium]
MRLEPTGLRRAAAAAIAGTGVAVAVALGPAAGAAHADVLDDLAQEFSTAAGAGQVSTLLNQSLKLRAAGVKPTGAELTAVQDALKYRPNQTPMIDALKDMVAGQSHRLEQAQAAKKGDVSIGINQYDPSSPGGITAGPGGINIGGGAWTIGDGRSPGQSVGPPR